MNHFYSCVYSRISSIKYRDRLGESFSVLMNGEKSKEGRKKGRRYKKWNKKVSRVSGEGKRSVYFLEQRKKVNMNIC